MTAARTLINTETLPNFPMDHSSHRCGYKDFGMLHNLLLFIFLGAAATEWTDSPMLVTCAVVANEVHLARTNG